MEQGRSSFGAAMLDKKLYICGGMADDEFLNSFEVYDPVTAK